MSIVPAVVEVCSSDESILQTLRVVAKLLIEIIAVRPTVIPVDAIGIWPNVPTLLTRASTGGEADVPVMKLDV